MQVRFLSVIILTESAGDYASGTNHTLPTNGYAKAYNGVNLDDFVKKITFQHITREGLENLGPTIMKMAESRGIQAHRNAVTIRLKNEYELILTILTTKKHQIAYTLFICTG